MLLALLLSKEVIWRKGEHGRISGIREGTDLEKRKEREDAEYNSTPKWKGTKRTNEKVGGRRAMGAREDLY